MSEKRGLLTSQEKKAYLERYKEADREYEKDWFDFVTAVRVEMDKRKEAQS